MFWLVNPVSSALPDGNNFATELLRDCANARFVSHQRTILLRAARNIDQRTRGFITSIHPDGALAAETPPGYNACFRLILRILLDSSTSSTTRSRFLAAVSLHASAYSETGFRFTFCTRHTILGSLIFGADFRILSLSRGSVALGRLLF